MTPAGPSPASRNASAVVTTTRAVCLGLFLGVLINLVMLYNDYYLDNTLLSLNHFPTVGMAVLLGLVGANALVLRRWGRAFTPGEIALIWSMTALAAGIGSTGFARGIIGFIASPAYFATATNEYADLLVRPLPSWAVLSKDLEDPAVRWYFEGLPRGERIPWGAWIVPLTAWIGFYAASYCVMFAFTSLLYRQWADRERLTFPIVYVPQEMAREPEGRSPLNAFFRSWVVWTGAALPLVIFGINGAHVYWPGIPEIPIHFGTWGWFAERPWREFNLGWAHLYFAIIGLSFLLTTEVSFSLWFFYLLYRLSYVFVAWTGAGGQGYFGNWGQAVGVVQSSGGILVKGGFLLWTARASLRAWGRRVRRGEDDREEDLLPPRLTAALLLVGVAGLVGFVWEHGAQWWAAALGMVLFICVILFLTRLVAEAGMLLVGVEAIGYEFLHRVFPSRWLTEGTLTTYVQLRGGVMSDLRELVMPYLMNGVRLCTLAGGSGRRVLAVFAVVIVVALGTASYGRISTIYKYGASQGDLAYNGWWQNGLYADVVKRLKSPPPFEWLRVGETPVLPVGASHLATGAGLTAAMLFLRSMFLWWPLNPLGYLVCASWPMTEIWFSILLGWIAKAAVMNFGGTVAYRRMLPFFLGLVLGHAIIATFWTIVSLVTGQPGVSLLPT